MPTPAELREEFRLTRDAIAREAVPELRRQLVQRGFALAQLADKMECDEAALKLPPRSGA